MVNVAGAFWGWLSPVVLGYWLTAAAYPPIKVTVEPFLGPVLNPFRSFVMTVLPQLPAVHYEKQVIATTDIVVAVLFILLFILSVVLGDFIQGLLGQAERLVFAQQNFMAKRAQAKQAVALKNEAQAFKQVLVYIEFPFKEHTQLAQGFFQFKQLGGESLVTASENHLVGFHNWDSALYYVLQISKMYAQYYQQLRPSDVKPPFKIVVDVLFPQDPLPEATQFCHQMVNRCGPNQVVASYRWRDAATQQPPGVNYNIRSMGLYQFADYGEVEMFLLEPQETSRFF